LFFKAAPPTQIQIQPLSISNPATGIEPGQPTKIAEEHIAN
jgi:hypothetical protein